jgi:hypothetical protein
MGRVRQSQTPEGTVMNTESLAKKGLHFEQNMGKIELLIHQETSFLDREAR